MLGNITFARRGLVYAENQRGVGVPRWHGGMGAVRFAASKRLSRPGYHLGSAQMFALGKATPGRADCQPYAGGMTRAYCGL